jgi:hypothetical protein
MLIQMRGFLLREAVRYVYRELKIETLNKLGLGLSGSVWSICGLIISFSV